MVRPRVLVVDDDPKVLSLMDRGLAFEGYAVDVAADGNAALAIARERPPHLVVLDVMMPGIDGLEVCRRLRATGGDLAILMLTGRASVPARIEGLDAGADDYLVKPFAFDELLARIRALLRRTLPPEQEVLEFDDLVLVPSTRDVTRAGIAAGADDAGVRAAGVLHAPPAPGALAGPDLRAGLGLRLPGRVERHRRPRHAPA